MSLNLNMKLINKIHDDAGEKSHIAITRDWSDVEPTLKYKDNSFYDQLYNVEAFMKASERIVADGCEDSYFSLNSFRRKEKQTCRIWHLNAFVLDFDFYKIDKYKKLTPNEMYEKYIKDALDLEPTSVVDSGRGLYVIYCFKHAPKGLMQTYKSIYRALYKKYSRYGMDPQAMNVTQIIRIPGSFNSKAFKEVEVLHFNDTEYQLKDFFPLFQYTREEVSVYKDKSKSDMDKAEVTSDQLHKRDIFRDLKTQEIIGDLKTLIDIRNQKKFTEGFREYLIYVARRRMRWKGASPDEELNVAHQLNSSLAVPLANKDVMIVCKPAGNTRCPKIETIISRLGITPAEQRQMKVLKQKVLKDSMRQRRARLLKLLNLTAKQKDVLERRTKVAMLKNLGKKNVEISRSLSVDRSTITRDLEFIRKNSWKFIKKIKDAMQELRASVDTEYFKRSTRYDEQLKLLEWLKIGEVLLE